MSKLAQRRKPKAKPGTKLTRFDQPTDDKTASRIARGLARFREQQGLTVPLAAEKYRIDQTAWYRIERGTHPETMIRHIDAVANKIGLDIIQLIKLGT